MQLSEFLQARLDAGESRSDIGRKVGVHPSYITRWLSGTVPETKLCRQIAEAYGLPEQAVLAMAGHYEASEKSDDPELDVWLREVAEIYQSFERSKWRDLTATFKGVASLSSPSPKDNAGGTPQRSIAEITLEEPLHEHPATAVNYDRAKELAPKRELAGAGAR